MGYNQGDIVWADFGPVRGHEQDGRRPALIISNHLLNQTGMYSVCPISTTTRRYPTGWKDDHARGDHGRSEPNGQSRQTECKKNRGVPIRHPRRSHSNY